MILNVAHHLPLMFPLFFFSTSPSSTPPLLGNSSPISTTCVLSTPQMMGKTDDDNYTLDDMFVSSAAQREGEGKEEERMRSRAIGESRRLAASLEKCQRCFSSQELQKHLIVAIGSKVRGWECGMTGIVSLC